MTITRPIAVAVFAAVTALGATSAFAQTASAAGGDARWAPWLGCWRSDNDLVGTGARVCVSRADGGITLRTIVGGQIVSEETRVADGAPRPVRDAGCSGSETDRWSADGLRAYRTVTASCGADPARSLASVSFFAPGSRWIDVQTVTASGTTNVRVTRYARAANTKLPDGTVVPTTPSGVVDGRLSRGWTTDEVIEMSRHLPPDGVQAAISEGPTAFRLNAKSLAAMADAGVTENVIDLMVAVTYPERFVVNTAGSGSSSLGVMTGPGWVDPFYAPIIGPAALYNCYSPYGWASADYWSGCSGFDSYRYSMFPGYYNGYFGYGYYGGWVPTQVPGDGGGGGSTPQAEGRLVNGRGYTQVRPVDTSAPGLAASGGTMGTNSTSSSGGSTSGGATSSGYSGGGSVGGGGGDRMAVPRPPGGGA